MAESLIIKTLLTVAVNYDDAEKDNKEETADNEEINEEDEVVDIEKDDFPDDEEVSDVWE